MQTKLVIPFQYFTRLETRNIASLLKGDSDILYYMTTVTTNTLTTDELQFLFF